MTTKTDTLVECPTCHGKRLLSNRHPDPQEEVVIGCTTCDETGTIVDAERVRQQEIADALENMHRARERDAEWDA